jgi:hypothetical protein
MVDPMARHVFISYSRVDRPYVERLAAYLTGAGLEVWFDEDIEPGDIWVSKIRDGLDSCAAVVLVASVAAAESTWVSAELERANGAGKPVLPLMLQDGAWTSKHYLHIFTHTQFENVVGGRMPEACVGKLRTLVGQAEAGERVAADDDPVARLKRALDGGRRIEARDIVLDATRAALPALAALWTPEPITLDDSDVAEVLGRQLAACEQRLGLTLRLVATGAGAGLAPGHMELWSAVLERLLAEPAGGRGTHSPWIELTRYPALLASYTMGVASVAAGNAGMLYPILSEVNDPSGQTVLSTLMPWSVLGSRYAGMLPEWGGAAVRTPQSLHLRRALAPVLAGVVEAREYERAFAAYEFLRSLFEYDALRRTSLGEYALQVAAGGPPPAVEEGVTAALQAGAFGGDPRRAAAVRQAVLDEARSRFA